MSLEQFMPIFVSVGVEGHEIISGPTTSLESIVFDRYDVMTNALLLQ